MVRYLSMKEHRWDKEPNATEEMFDLYILTSRKAGLTNFQQSLQ